MRVLALVLLSLVSVGYGRKLQARRQRVSEEVHGSEVRRVGKAAVLERLAGLLLAGGIPAAGWQVVGCGPKLARHPLQTSPKHCRRPAARGPAMQQFADDKKELESQLEAWRIRQGGVQSYYRYLVEIRENSRKSEEDKAERRAEGETAEDEATKSAVVSSVVAVVVGALVLRVGGRAALISILGLNIMEEFGISDKIDQAVALADQAGGWAVVAFLAAWIVAKVFCIDAIAIALGFSSGVLFGGVFQGAALSVFGATLGSLTAFFLSRTFLQERVEGFIEKQPVARGLAKVVEKDGFKTVLVLRISPILPAVPIAAYSYIYGTSKINPLTFASATALGSVKPYLLDSYVGVFSKQLLDGDTDSSKDLILLVGLGVLVLVGVFASQIATEAVELVEKEIKEGDKNALKDGLPGASEATTDSENSMEGPGPFNINEIRTSAWGLLPADVRSEWEEVKIQVDKFIDNQWEPAVRAELAKESEKEKRRERIEQAEKEGYFPDILVASSSTTNQTRLAEIQVAAEEAYKNGNFFDILAVMKMTGERDEAEGALEERQWLSEWALQGPEPWRRLLSGVYIPIGILGACQRRWKGYPENVDEFREVPKPPGTFTGEKIEQEEKSATEGEGIAPAASPTVATSTVTDKPTTVGASETAEAIEEKIQTIQERLASLQEEEDRLNGK